MRVPGLTACIITRNEAGRIGDCLASVSFCDEIVVVDAHSSDATREIAARLGARVIERDWPGYRSQKQYATDAATHDWVLSVDADERVTPGLRAEIESLRDGGFAGARGWSIPRLTEYFGRFLRHGNAWPDRHIRLYDRRAARWTGYEVHEKIVVSGPVGALGAPLTLENFAKAWAAAPFARYFVNTTLLVAMILAVQLVLCTLAAYAFARFAFAGRSVAFLLVLVQLMIMPDVLIVENYRTMSRLGLLDTLAAIGLPYMASAFGIFLLRQTFKTVPKELDEAARVEGAGPLEVLWRVYVPLAKPVYIAYALVSVSYHWNNFLWPLIVTNSVQSRPLTVGLQVFSSVDQGVDWSIITAATLMTSGPLLVAFLLFQRQFVQSFMRAGIR